MKFYFFSCVMLALAGAPLAARAHDKDGETGSDALKNAVILVIRHAEKPDRGAGLSPMGEQRAGLYVNYFKSFSVDSRPLKIDYIFAAADSAGSHRPRLTVEPLAGALGRTIDSRFKDKEFERLAAEIRARPHGRHILICWHHGEIPQLLRALGADADSLIPKAKWPEQVFGWVIQLRYDDNGRLVDARRINENLLPDDSDAKM